MQVGSHRVPLGHLVSDACWRPSPQNRHRTTLRSSPGGHLPGLLHHRPLGIIPKLVVLNGWFTFAFITDSYGLKELWISHPNITWPSKEQLSVQLKEWGLSEENQGKKVHCSCRDVLPECLAYLKRCCVLLLPYTNSFKTALCFAGDALKRLILISQTAWNCEASPPECLMICVLLDGSLQHFCKRSA